MANDQLERRPIRIYHKALGGMKDSLHSVSLYCKALSVRPRASLRQYFMSPYSLADSLVHQYDHQGNMEDLEDAISLYRDALCVHPPGHSHRSRALINLASSLIRRYELGNMEDLEDAISLYRDALRVHPPGHCHHSTALINLASSIVRRYEQLGNMEDLEDAISLYRDALRVHPPGHSHRSRVLINLASSLIRRYSELGNMEDLEDAISFSHDALSLCPPGHPRHSKALTNLAYSLTRRYRQLGKIEDLENVISLRRDAVSLCPPGHPGHSVCLIHLAASLGHRYDQLGKTEDLEDAISFIHDALNLCPPAHLQHSISLNYFALSLARPYHQVGEYLENVISFSHDALSLCPPGHPRHSQALDDLAYSLSRRYNQLGEIEDLENVISLRRDAVSLCPPGHPEQSIFLTNLANSLANRYNQLGKMEDLEDAISFIRDALNLCPPGHHYRFTALTKLADHLMDRYAQLGKMEDLEEAISLDRDALRLALPGHPQRSSALRKLAGLLIKRYLQLEKMEDFQEAFISFEQAASDFTSYLPDRIKNVIEWTIEARCYNHQSTLLAYTTLFHLLNRSLISRPSVESQQGVLATADIPRSLASDAASAAIKEGKLERAVELLEQGRAILWSRVDAYTYPLEQLRLVDGGGSLADRLEKLSAELKHLALSSGSATTSEKATSGVAFAEAQIRRHRILSEEWEDLVGRIRKFEGFSHFLQAAPFHILQSAAAEGPVILVNISEFRSDAIILCIDNPPILVKLPMVRPADLLEQGRNCRSDRGIGSVLRYLWDNIVSLVVDRLTQLGIPKKSRIWWCPTAELCALPLHAAGPHRGGQKNLSDIYTSSYTSTLSSLIRARSNRIQSTTIPKLLVVGHPSDTLKLERVEVEVDVVKNLGPRESVDVLFGSNATCEAVLASVKEHPWVHFACHGHLGKDSQPFQASFELHDGRRLTLLELIQARIPNAELAFLSACHTAEGDTRTPDESIHLSAASQFCGFRSVVGTLWEMDDEDGPMISEEFYKYMFRNPGRIDFRDSAEALNSAIRAMRKAKLPPERWAMFVHIGA